MIEIVRKSEESWKRIALSWASLAFMFLLMENASESFLGLGAAALFTVCFALNPVAYRNRRGSFRTVYGLMAFLWLCGVVPTILTWL